MISLGNIFTEGAEQQNILYAHVAALTLWMFEHLIITDLEVTYIWKSYWNMIKVLYIFVRYGTYIDVILNTIVATNQAEDILGIQLWDSGACKTEYQAIIWLMMIGIAASDLIFNLRVWAVWRKTRTMAIILITLNIGFLIPVWVTWGLFSNSLEFFNVFTGCTEVFGTSLLPLAAWAVLLTYQTVMLLLMLPPAFTAFKLGGRSNMTSIIIRDVAISLNPVFFSMVAIHARVAYAALSCRVILHIRE
ncbi:hypothetical protein BDQ17DRAFT_814010 [Cyathus striatus]|nr:hypothetical protein BDQ17DRAFT_814010 [Cyathus striatus]